MHRAARDALARFVKRLRRLHRDAGSPSLRRMELLTQHLDRPLQRSTVSDKLAAKSLPDWDFVISFVTACADHATSQGRPLPPARTAMSTWDTAHRAMLSAFDRARADATLAHAARRHLDSMPPGRHVPRQLPPEARHFTGRSAELAALDRFLDHHETGTVLITAIAGMAGIGKTTLALQWAHRNADRFPDGQLYVNLRGFDPAGSPVQATEAVRGFLGALGVAPERMPRQTDAQIGLYRTLLADRRTLVVLDNAADSDQVRPLLPGSKAFVVITSRRELTGLVTAEGAEPLMLDVLTTNEAHAFLRRRLGQARLDAEPQAVAEIVAGCAGLPLALAIVAARAAIDRRTPLREFADQVTRVPRDLIAFDGNDSGAQLRAVFRWSFASLDPASAAMIRLMALHPGPDLDVAAAATLHGTGMGDARRILNGLRRASLIEERRPDRYSMHDLMRVFAAEAGIDDPASRAAAARRCQDHYLHWAHAAALRLDPHRDPITPRTTTEDIAGSPPSDTAAAADWFATEHAVLLNLLRHSPFTGNHSFTGQLAWCLADYLDRHGHWQEQAEAQTAALEAARLLGDPELEARASRGLAHAYIRLNRYADAADRLEAAITIFDAIGDPAGQAHTLLNLGWLLEHQDRFAEALKSALEALDCYRRCGHRVGEALALSMAAWHHTKGGDHDQAVAMAEQAIELHRELGDRVSQAGTLDTLGHALHHLGAHGRAIGCFLEALDLSREHSDRFVEATVLDHLGDTHDAAGDRPAAVDCWERSLSILTELGDAETGHLAEKLEAARVREGLTAPGR